MGCWRPITLLNVDFKIIARAMSLRLGKVLPTLVGDYQSSGVPGRPVTDSLHLTRDVLNYVSDRNLAAALVSLDQSKAFDRVDHSFLFYVLAQYGIPGPFISLLRLLYAGASSRVQVNGELTQPFLVSRGVRQGCPLSPLLYVLVIETLLVRLNKCPRIVGIPVPGEFKRSVKVVAHADDVTVFLSSTLSFNVLFSYLDIYSRGTGALLNYEKTGAMWLGKWRGCRDTPGGLSWTAGPLRILGVQFDPGGVSPNSWISVGKKFFTTLNEVEGRVLSFRSKVQVIKSLILPVISFVGSVSLVPDYVFRRLQGAIFKFFWSGKQEWLSRATLFKPPPVGGMGVPDIRVWCQALAIKSLSRFLRDRRAPMYHFVEFFLSFNVNLFDASFSNARAHCQNSTGFYRELVSLIKETFRKGPGFSLDASFRVLYANFKFPVDPEVVVAGDPNLDWCQVWKFAQHKCVEGSRRDLSFKAAHDVLPVRHRLFRFGISRTDTCPFCRAPETCRHLLFECPLARLVWDEVSRVFKLSRVEWQQVCYFHFHPIPRNVQLPFLLCSAEVKMQLWIARNKAIYEHHADAVQDVLSRVRGRLRLRLRAELCRVGALEFRRVWCSPPLLCRLIGGTVELLW